jgi:hypothetical protein
MELVHPDHAAKVAANISASNRLMERIAARPQRKISLWRKAWLRVLDAWPLQWKRRDESDW